MVIPGRRKSVAFFIGLGIGLIIVIILLYVGWVMLNWRTGILLALGVLLLTMIIAGIVVNTTFLVREIRRNEQHDAFINAVTHELKTPVASIRLYLQTLQSRDIEAHKRQQFYQIMLEDSDRLLSTIEQVLKTGRIGAAARKPNLAPVELDSVIHECMKLARTVHHLEPGALKYETSQAVTLMADPEEVRAAISNLIDNAVKYSGKSVDVTIDTKSVDGRFIEIWVKDRGVGIPKVELKHIFKRFYRVPGPLAARIKGTGLGLFIVRSVAKRHGGRVWAESEGPGRGSTFVLQLPMAR